MFSILKKSAIQYTSLMQCLTRMSVLFFMLLPSISCVFEPGWHTLKYSYSKCWSQIEHSFAMLRYGKQRCVWMQCITGFAFFFFFFSLCGSREFTVVDAESTQLWQPHVVASCKSEKPVYSPFSEDVISDQPLYQQKSQLLVSSMPLIFFFFTLLLHNRP